MSERYTKLFALPENLYSVGAPVVIAAGALQKDNQTGKVFAQLKIRNIQDKSIKAATVKITPFDPAGKPLGEAVDYQYLDLTAERDADFGQKTPVILPEAATRSFSVSVSEVIFSDNSIWTASNEAWKPLSIPVTPEKEFTDGELAKQYRVKYGVDCKCVFKKEKDLWRCACGAVNHDSEKICHSCQRARTTLAALNVDELKADRDQRLAAEQKKAAEEKAAAAAQAKKTKKIAMIATPIAIVVIVAMVLFSGYSKKNNAYNDAMALLEKHQFDDAMDAFAELEDFKDSNEQAYQNAPYQKAVYLIECAENDDESGLRLSNRTAPKPKPAKDENSGGATSGTMASSQAPSASPSGGSDWFDSDFETIPSVMCYRKAAKILTQLDGYKDSAALLERIKVSAYDAQYDHAMTLLLEEYKYEAAYNTLMNLDGYKDSAEIAQQMLDENTAVKRAEEAYQKGNLEPYMKVIQNNQYIKINSSDEQNLKFLYPFIGRWEYLSGDATTLTKSSDNDKDYSESYSVEARFRIIDRVPYILIDYGKYYERFEVDFEKQELKTEKYSRGSISAELTAQDTLLVKRSYVSYASGKADIARPTCEYKRAG